MFYESKTIRLRDLAAHVASGWYIAPTNTCGYGYIEVRRNVVQERA